MYDYDLTRRILSVFGFAICVSASGLTVNRIVVSVLKKKACLSDIRFIYEVTTHTNTTPREDSTCDERRRSFITSILATI